MESFNVIQASGIVAPASSCTAKVSLQRSVQGGETDIHIGTECGLVSAEQVFGIQAWAGHVTGLGVVDRVAQEFGYFEVVIDAFVFTESVDHEIPALVVVRRGKRNLQAMGTLGDVQRPLVDQGHFGRIHPLKVDVGEIGSPTHTLAFVVRSSLKLP